MPTRAATLRVVRFWAAKDPARPEADEPSVISFADHYEVAGYMRVSAKLKSGATAWVYIRA